MIEFFRRSISVSTISCASIYFVSVVFLCCVSVFVGEDVFLLKSLLNVNVI